MSANAALSALRTVVAATASWRDLCGIVVGTDPGELTENQAQAAGEARIVIFGLDHGDTHPGFPFATIAMAESTRRPVSTDSSETRGTIDLCVYTERALSDSYNEAAGELGAWLADFSEDIETTALTMGGISTGEIITGRPSISDGSQDPGIWEAPMTIAFPREV